MDKINVIVGPKGAGKSSVLKIANFRGIYAHELSDSIKMLDALGLERDDMKHGLPWDESALRLSYEYCLKNMPKPLFLSGCSRPLEVEYLKKNHIPYRVVSIDSSPKLRYKRVLDRARPGEIEISWEDFLIKDKRRLGTMEGFEANDLEELMNVSDYHIENESSLSDLIKMVDTMLYRFGYLK